jgi:hypothetical protein
MPLFLNASGTDALGGNVTPSKVCVTHRVAPPDRSNSHALFPALHPNSRAHVGPVPARMTRPAHDSRLHAGTARTPFASYAHARGDHLRRLGDALAAEVGGFPLQFVQYHI